MSEPLRELRDAAQRLVDAIADRVAVQGMGWEREMDADAEHLAALKALRSALAAQSEETP